MNGNEFLFSGSHKCNFVPALLHKENDPEHTQQRIFLLSLHTKFKDTYSGEFCKWQWWLIPQMEYSRTSESINTF